MKIRKADDRGLTKISWLYSRHSFSFGEYYDPKHMGFHTLRVINDDVVAPGAGFGMHGHRDMEIITIVVKGELEHRDSLGHGEVLRPGEVQVMTAGSGIRHSEFNPSPEHPARFIQIWIEPRTVGLSPSYEQRRFPPEAQKNVLLRVAGAAGSDSALPINQDAHIYRTTLEAHKTLSHSLPAGRAAWVQVIEGQCSINKVEITSGDGVSFDDGEGEITITGRGERTELIVFELAVSS